MNASAPLSRRRFPLGWVLRLALSLIVLAVIFRIVPLAQVWREAQRLSPLAWSAALLVFLAGHAAAAAKWRLLIGAGVTFTHAFQAHLAGLAANLCLPGLAGGDVVRAGLVFREAEDRSRLVIGSIADRLLDMFGLLVFATLGALLLWRPQYGEQRMLAWFLLASALGVLVLVALFAVTSRLADRALSGMRERAGLRGVMARAVSVAAQLAHEPARLVLCLGISMAVQAMFIAINIAFASALDVTAPRAAWFFAWSTAKIVAIVPISLGGLGVREATLARLLAPFGADPTQVVAIGLVWQTVLYASGLVGALALVAWKPVRAATAARRSSPRPLEPSP